MTSLFHKLTFLLLLLTALTVSGQTFDSEGIPDVPVPYRLVNDFAQMISNENDAALEAKLLAYNDSTSTQIYVVTVETVGDYSIEDYALRLGRKWEIGQKDKNNGILILVSKQDRKVDIEVGYGLESFVTDYDSKAIIDDLIVPAFKQNNYYKGLNDATDRIIGLTQGNFEHATAAEPFPLWMIVIVIAIVIFILMIMASGKSSVTVSGGGWTFSGGGGTAWGGGGSSWGGGGGGFSGGGGGSFGGGGSSGSW